ncbi:acetyl/propionyl/methylcrotonyl-CoA carboxylase subunit alpha [Alcaligenes phenolicus]|uniref:Biotin carboxylase n=1 Tax=Alcaligenes phenolicus TaxID=232846 RepID=A0AAW5VSI9_9BURK|nr:biotin carboxylase N-terminal domain-containing protein [Alcaligenes phenolicus]MCX5564282.1 biotin carboxylase [Alcaligenes phenolicus]
MIDSLLIANRGEIACRIIKTCRRLGIHSIAVHSDADANARHVLEADETVYIGPSEAIHSYLNPAVIIEAARSVNAQAIHPGYGFLSEKPELPQLCKEQGIIWVGPRAEVIRQMGSKIEAKRIAQEADVLCVPGYHGENQTPEALHEEAMRIGFPLLIKASAGGGGKGMRRVDSADDFLLQLTQAKEEARRAFGDDAVLLEKLIIRPRHLEVQLLGDHHGNLVHMFERECSIQRNYQKMIEESPAAWLSQETRTQLLEAAVRIGNRIQYDSAGTVEFVLDEDTGTPYFLEMNTRLQVEHTVTEMVTGLDLVELQIRAACGEPMALKQDDIRIKGWAIQARVNCEDPSQSFQPQIGTVVAYNEPRLTNVRTDSGVQAATTISPYYDSMAAKVIGYGVTRAHAAERLAAGLDEFRMVGVGTNQALLHEILTSAQFTDAPLTTLFMATHYPDGWQCSPEHERIMCATAAWLSLFPNTPPSLQNAQPWHAADGFRIIRQAGGLGGAELRVTAQRGLVEFVRVSRTDDIGRFEFASGERLQLHIHRHADGAVIVTPPESASMRLDVVKTDEGHAIYWRGMEWRTSVTPGLEVEARTSGSDNGGKGVVSSPMPGVITEVRIQPGQAVAAGDTLLVMEAMKLIHSLDSEVDGVVKSVHCNPGETVGMGVSLIEIEPNQA